MKWNKYTITTTTEAEDFVSSMLEDLGVEGVQIEDNVPLSEEDKEILFIDILPELPADEGVAYVSFFVDADAPEEETNGLLRQVEEELENLHQFTEVGAGTIATDQTEDEDWINNWKEFFKPFTIDDIYIKPTWEDSPVEGDYSCVIQIDPGTSFGTGKHETTQLCIRQIRKFMKQGDTVLDVGAGSGILSIIAMKLGAGRVNGTDIDPICMDAIRDNMEVNGLLEEMGDFYHGNLIDDTNLQEKVGTECYDIVVANILADIIIPLTPVVPARLKKGGIYITSGIIDFKEPSVIEAIEKAGLEIVEVTHQGEWVGITARKN